MRRKEKQRQPVINCTVHHIPHPPALPGPEEIEKMGSEAQEKGGLDGTSFMM